MWEAAHEIARPPMPTQGDLAKAGRPDGTGWSEYADQLRRRLTELEAKLTRAQCTLKVDGDRARPACAGEVGWPAHAAKFRRHLAVIESRAAEFHALKQSEQTPPRNLAAELAGQLDNLAGHWNELELAHERLVAQLEAHQSPTATNEVAGKTNPQQVVLSGHPSQEHAVDAAKMSADAHVPAAVK